MIVYYYDALTFLDAFPASRCYWPFAIGFFKNRRRVLREEGSGASRRPVQATPHPSPAGLLPQQSCRTYPAYIRIEISLAGTSFRRDSELLGTGRSFLKFHSPGHRRENRKISLNNFNEMECLFCWTLIVKNCCSMGQDAVMKTLPDKVAGGATLPRAGQAPPSPA